MNVYQIKDWNSHFENAKSRERISCSFVCVPNKQHGLSFSRIMAEPDGAMIYGIWCLILGACSQQKKPREGWLTSDGYQTGTPWASEDLALKFRRPKSEIERALQVIVSQEIGWIITHEYPLSTRLVPAECPRGIVKEEKEENRIEEKEVGLRPPSTIKTPKVGTQPQAEPHLPSNLANDPALKKAADAQWLAELKVKYSMLNVDQEIEKARRWAKGKGAKFSRPLVVSWLNRTAEGASELSIEPPPSKIYSSAAIREQEREEIIRAAGGTP